MDEQDRTRWGACIRALGVALRAFADFGKSIAELDRDLRDADRVMAYLEREGVIEYYDPPRKRK